jgi:serine-type D-Ala-D-Ala carboxypeptidase (penicillin-binding protein 5/6)
MQNIFKYLGYTVIFFALTASVVVLGGGLFIRLQKKPLLTPVLGLSRFDFSDNIWFPKDATSSPKSLELNSHLTAKAAFFVETTTGEVLYEKNSKERLHIASLIKIMTAIITLDNKDLDDKILISKKASDMEPDKMLLIVGERLSVEELLQGIFLVSANDSAEALSEGVTGRREEFLNLMNSKAQLIGMKDTYFINPTGLEEDGRAQYSTAYDVMLMSKYAITKYPKLLEISSKPHIFIEKTSEHQDYDLYSGINLLTTYPGVMGFKTGYTPEAGLTLVTIARRGGKEVIGVLLGSTERREDAKLMLDYSFEKLGVKE